MKKLCFRTMIVLAALTGYQNGQAQSSLDVRWGYSIPVNDQLNKSYYNPGSFSIGWLHSLPAPRFQAGIKFSREKYAWKKDQNSVSYCDKMILHNYLVTGRYTFIQDQALDFYTELDAGLNRSYKRVTKNGATESVERTGATVGMGLGLEVKISSRTLIGTSIRLQYAYTDDLDYYDNINTHYILNTAVQIGLRFLLKQKP